MGLVTQTEHLPDSLCEHSGRSGVLVSIAVGDETAQCSWVQTLMDNVMRLSREDTHVVLHLSSTLKCADIDLNRWRHEHRRLILNPARLTTRAGTGSVLRAHLLNARHAATKWASEPNRCCCSFIMQSSNMLWLRPGMEQRVMELGSSLGRTGWGGVSKLLTVRLMQIGIEAHTKGTVPDQKHLPSYLPAQSLLTTAAVYHNLTASSIHSMPLHAFEYHEGSFYPLATVLRFLSRIELLISSSQMDAAMNYPEEFWLQAYVLNHEDANLAHPTSQQLCLRSLVAAGKTAHGVHAAERLATTAGCSLTGRREMNRTSLAAEYVRFFAFKRFVRDCEEKVTAYALNLTAKCFSKSCGTGSLVDGVVTGESVRRDTDCRGLIA
mmetsp:Transcript_4430/g.11622  ORF Transcript_4430/g.11622 Transcript_4430/m.11622 type:complete len:380 (+) Transcript_4430:62-1201(+)